MNFSSYKGKRVVVTGCASGASEATARPLGGVGAEVVAADISEPTIDVAPFPPVNLADPRSAPLSFLNSDLTSHVNGAGLTVDGGYVAHLALDGQLWD